ncbi:hypothetical protein AJ78_01000 [Emergomyces pasteurianus Ep9510]|uniref:Uncharacterized protein n=1 Tax=Emergomyces pasteurianus Ep9510 TaxID=1447872 RepID=A0A1J9PRK8_9EURO|nr:hypothetical protein AJ78_01000 [Emergomyces pasteurianus Ep9510]
MQPARRQTGGLTLPKTTKRARFAAPVEIPEKETEGQQNEQADRNPPPEYTPQLPPKPQKPPRPQRPRTCQTLGKVHPRSPSGNEGSNKRPKLDESRKAEPGKFSAILGSSASRNGTIHLDDGNLGFASEPIMTGTDLLEEEVGGGFSDQGQSKGSSPHTSQQEQRQVLLDKLREVERRQTLLVGWEKTTEGKFSWLSGERRAAEQKLLWLQSEEAATRMKLEWFPGELRMVEQGRARVLSELLVNEERQTKVLNQLEVLESGKGGGKRGADKGVVVFDEEMMEI